LAGCTHELPAAPLPVPQSLLACTAEPAVPADGVDYRGLSDYVLRVVDAADDCRTKLSAVAGVLQANQKPKQ